MKILLSVCFGILLLSLVTIPASGWNNVGKIKEWEGDPEMRPYDIATISDGSAWMTHEEAGTGALITLDYESGELATYTAPGSAHFLTLDNAPDDTLWIADTTGKLWHFFPGSHTFASYSVPPWLPASPPEPYGVSVAGDGRVWITSQSTIPYLAVFNPGTVSWTKYEIPTGGTYPPGIPVEIDFESDGTVWFTIKKTESGGGYGGLGRLDPTTGTFTVWTSPATFFGGSIPRGGLVNPWGIVVTGHDPARVWFVDKTGSFLLRFDEGIFPDVEWYDLMPDDFIDSHFIARDPDGNIWLASYGPNHVGAFDPDTGTITRFDPVTAKNPIGITISELGEVWWPGSGVRGGGRTPETGMGRFIPFKDSDHDGIDNRIDTRPHTRSTTFFDTDTNTKGTIKSRGNQKLTITKATSPNGVRILSSSGSGGRAGKIVMKCPVSLGGRQTIRITRNDDCIATCGRPLLVLRGEISGIRPV